MEIDRAKAIAQVANVLVESAKTEIKFLATTGGEKGTGFIPADPEERAEKGIPRFGDIPTLGTKRILK